MVDNVLLRHYLVSWLDNVGRSIDSETTVAEAMSDDQSLIEWGLKKSRYDNIDFDYDYALSVINGKSPLRSKA